MAWTDVDILNALGVSTPVGVYNDGTVNHPSAVPIASPAAADTSSGLSTSNLDITIDPKATWAMIDLGAASPVTAFYVYVSGRYRAGGDFYSVPIIPANQLHQRQRSGSVYNYAFEGSSSPNFIHSRYRIDLANSHDVDGSRILWVPVFGLHTLRLVLDAGTLASVVVRQLTGQAPFDLPVGLPKLATTIYPDIGVDTTIYAQDEVIGGSVNAGDGGKLTLGHMADGGFRVKSLAFGDYVGTLGDLDVIILNPDSEALADHDPLDFSYPEAIRGWLEFRATPAAGQYPLRDLGATGGSGGVASDLDIMLDYMDYDSSNNDARQLVQVVVVQREAAGITFAGSGDIFFEIGVLL